MRILLSAYACEPDKGSEPAVGWNWSVELARLGYEVHVITRSNNRASIAAVMEKEPCDNLHFFFYDLPAWLKWWKKGQRGVHLYYFLWQVGIYFVAKNLVKKSSYDVIHHVTFVSARQPSFLGLLGIPFVFGPVAGGERAPFRLRKSFPLRGWFTDAFRDLVNQWARISPLMRMTFHTAHAIYVTSEQSKNLVPKRYYGKTVVNLAIGLDDELSKNIESTEGGRDIRVLYVGRLLYWKGIHFALRGFSELLKQNPNARFTILGKGPDAQWLRDLAKQLEIDAAIEWLDWMPRNELNAVYQRHHIFLFPSLRDSGGMVVLEAMKNSLPVVCLDIGGPSVIVDETCGYRIATGGRSEDEVVSELGFTLVDYMGSPEKQKCLAEGAVKRAEQMKWDSLVKLVTSGYGF